MWRDSLTDRQENCTQAPQQSHQQVKLIVHGHQKGPNNFVGESLQLSQPGKQQRNVQALEELLNLQSLMQPRSVHVLPGQKGGCHVKLQSCPPFASNVHHLQHQLPAEATSKFLTHPEQTNAQGSFACAWQVLLCRRQQASYTHCVEKAQAGKASFVEACCMVVKVSLISCILWCYRCYSQIESCNVQTCDIPAFSIPRLSSSQP